MKKLAIVLFCATLSSTHARDLPEILRASLVAQPEILEAQANERIAESRLEIAQASKYPTLAVRANQPVLRNSGDYGFNPVLEAKWTVYDFGKRDTDIHKERLKADYFSEKTSETEEEFLYQLAGYYLEALRADMALEVALQNRKRHQEIVRKMGIIHQYDSGRRSELTQAQARLLQVEESIVSYERLRNLALSRLSRYVQPAVSPDELNNPFANLSEAQLLTQYPSTLVDIRNNASYRAQKEELAATQAEHDATKLTYYPDINILGETNRHDTAVYLSVTFDVFDRTKAPSIEQKRHQVDAAQARLDSIEANLLERVDLAVLQMREDQLRIEIADNQIRTSQQVAADYEDQFTIAQRSLLDVVNAYSELANIEQLRVNAKYDLMQTKLDYLSAVGKLSQWAGISQEPIYPTPSPQTAQPSAYSEVVITPPSKATYPEIIIRNTSLSSYPELKITDTDEQTLMQSTWQAPIFE